MADTLLLAESALANTDALLLDALRRWKAAVLIYRNDPRPTNDPEWERLLQNADDIVTEIADIPASGLEGVAIKLFLSLEQGIGMASDTGFDIAFHITGDRHERIAEPTLMDALRLAPDVAEILGAFSEERTTS